jgi:hypothetical protein
MPPVAGRSIKDLLVEFTRTWYDRYAIECDRAADRQSAMSKKPAANTLEQQDLSA